MWKQNKCKNKNSDIVSISESFGGVPGAIRTRGLSLRRRTLYPAELRRHGFRASAALQHFNYATLFPRCQGFGGKIARRRRKGPRTAPESGTRCMDFPPAPHGFLPSAPCEFAAGVHSPPAPRALPARRELGRLLLLRRRFCRSAARFRRSAARGAGRSPCPGRA